MEIKLELLKKEIAQLIEMNIENLEIDADKIVQATAVEVLGEIKEVINNTELNDFMMVDEIVEIFRKYGIDSGGRHDF